MNKWILSIISFLLLCLSFNLQATEPKGKVLIIMSHADKLPLKDKKTADVGFFLNEFAIPTQALIDAGYEVVIATPQGKKPIVDKSSEKVEFFENDQEKMNNAIKLADKMLTAKNIKNLTTVADGNLKQYAGVFIPGGHAPMVDLIVDPNVGKILTYFHENNKPTAMICHGPIASLSAMGSPAEFRKNMIRGNLKSAAKLANDWVYKDYEMTILSTDEEKGAEKGKLHGNVQFYPEVGLKTAGAKIKNGAAMQSNVVEDKELITGQNPASDAELAKAFINALDKNTGK